MARGVIADALAKGAPAKDEEDERDIEADEDDEDDDLAPSDLEIRAVKALDRATTPEAKAMALKAFVKACMAGGDY